MKERTKPAPYGTCRAEECTRLVTMTPLERGEDPDGGRIRARAFCYDQGFHRTSPHIRGCRE